MANETAINLPAGITPEIWSKLSEQERSVLSRAIRQAKHADRKLTVKASAKGAVSVYGLNARFPVTLYANQWRKLSEFMDDVLTFIDDNSDSLSWEKDNGDSE